MPAETHTMPKARQEPHGPSRWFTVPAPLARLFKKFPILTYPPNEMPARSPNVRDVATLFIFISEDDALKGLPSFNPSCLKWQTFLKLASVHFGVLPSNNHASPSGALPFLLHHTGSNNSKPPPPVPSSRLEQYALDHGTPTVPDIPFHLLEAYETLLDYRIRDAWLYAMYLAPANAALLARLYLKPASSSRVVRKVQRHQLRRAAEAEILRLSGRPAVDPALLYRGAEEAFGALESLLGEGPWFFDSSKPVLFDAAVFAYTHLILDEGLEWGDRRLADILNKFPGLVSHRNRIFQRCWGPRNQPKFDRDVGPPIAPTA
ncbi:hypothetical protein GGR56DRAFT_143302 [Xylariaceae sp. FL0804]|nr:hypothetical protein GGR56DRAFT_143302 [Xylariaceae sp. FL0804]